MARRKNINPSVDAFRQVPLFDGCHRSELERIGRVADEVLLRPGFPLLRQGDLPLDCFLLVDGDADVIVDGAVVGTVTAPALIGSRSLQQGSRRTASVVTTGPARVFSMVYSGFRQLMDVPLAAERVLTGDEVLAECMLSMPLTPTEVRSRPMPQLAST